MWTTILHAPTRPTPAVVAARPLSLCFLTQLLCCGALLLLCATCNADNIIIFRSLPSSYDETQAACASSGGALVEARTPAIEKLYTTLMEQQAKPLLEVVAFLGGSRDFCGTSLSDIRNCDWCWRANERAQCGLMSVFYHSSLRQWGRAVPGMFVNWARGYPGGPRTQQFMAHTLRRKGWVDAMYRSRRGMSHTICYIRDSTPGGTTVAPGSGGNTASPEPQTSSMKGWLNNELTSPDRRGVGGSWWVVVAVVVIVGGSLVAGAHYYLQSQNDEKGPREFQQYDVDDFDPDTETDDIMMETDSDTSMYLNQSRGAP